MATREDPDQQDPFGFGSVLERRRRDPSSFGDVLRSRRGRGVQESEGEPDVREPRDPEPVDEPAESPEERRARFRRVGAGPGPKAEDVLREEGPSVLRDVEPAGEPGRGLEAGPFGPQDPVARRAMAEAMNREARRAGLPEEELPEPAFEETPGGSLYDPRTGELVTLTPSAGPGRLQRRETEPTPGVRDVVTREEQMATGEELRRRRGRYEPMAGVEPGAAFDFFTRDVSLGAGRGFMEAGMATATGATELAGLEDAERELRQTREELRGFFGETETGAGQAARIATRLSGELAQFIAPEMALTRLGALPAKVSTLRRIGREIALGAPLDAVIAASDRENSLAGFAAEFVKNQLAEGETMIGPDGREIGYEELSRELEEIADTPWKRALFDATAGSVLAGGAVAGLEWISNGLARARGGSPEDGASVLRESVERAHEAAQRRAEAIRRGVGPPGEARGPQRGAQDVERPPADEAERGLATRLRQRAVRALGGVPEEEAARLRTQAQTDELTGLPNTRGEAERLERRPPAEGTERHELMVDVDNFKAWNDRFGQKVGDRFLEQMGRILEGVAREEDAVSVARIGGDEFRLHIDTRAGTDVEGLRARIQEQVNAEMAARGMDRAGETPIGATVFEPGRKTEAKRAAGRSRPRGELEAERRPAPLDVDPEESEDIARQASLEGDVETVLRAEARLTQAGVHGRQAPVDAPVGPRGERPSADVFALSRGDVDLDPQRFQYKTEGKQAAGRALEGVEEWDYSKAGVMSVWWDEEAGQWFVVNGHNRMGLADRVLDEDAPVNVMEIHAATPEEARAVGAMQNIAEGRGTPIDAAKFFRDADLGPEEIRDLNIPMTETKVQKGLALAELHPAIFDDVVAKRVKLNRAVIIGESGLPPEQQLAIHTSEDINDLNQGELEELIRLARGAGSRTTRQETLLGTEAFQESNFLERVKISRHVKRELARDRRMVEAFTQAGRAERAEAKGVAKVDTERAGELGKESARFEEVYEGLSTRSGPVADILNQHARAVGAGDETLREAQDAATKEIREALRGFLEEGGLAREFEETPQGLRPVEPEAEAPGAPGGREELPGGGRAGAEGGTGDVVPDEVQVDEADVRGRFERDLDQKTASELRNRYARRLTSYPGDPMWLGRHAQMLHLAALKASREGESVDTFLREARRTLEQAEEALEEQVGAIRRMGEDLDRRTRQSAEAVAQARIARDMFQEATGEGAARATTGEPRFQVERSGGTPSQGRYAIRDTETGEVVARANYQDAAVQQADEFNAEAGAPTIRGEGPAGEDDLELFERAAEAYGPSGELTDAVARSVTDFENRRAGPTYGSSAEANDVAEDVAQFSFDFSDNSLDGVPRAADRMQAVQEGAQRRSWVDIRGQKIEDAGDAHRLLYPFRHPKAERHHFLLLDEAGRVISHTAETSGAVNWAVVAPRQQNRVYQRAKKLGASEIVLVHNHPSGATRPSKEDRAILRQVHARIYRNEVRDRLRQQALEQGFTPDASELERHARNLTNQELYRGQTSDLTVQRQYIIDHDEVSEVVFAPDQADHPGAVDVRSYNIEHPELAAADDWTQVHGRKLTSPSQAAVLVGSADRPRKVDVLYLDSQMRALAVEPHGLEAFGNVEDWLPRQMRAYGAGEVLFLTNTRDADAYTVALRAANRVRTNPELHERVRDVIMVEPGGTAGASAAGDETLHPVRKPKVTKDDRRRVFERGIPDQEEVTEATVHHPPTGRTWRGRSHFDALQKVPSDVDVSELEDGYATTHRDHVSRREAMALEEEAGDSDMTFGTSEELRRSPSQAARERARRAVDEFGTTEDAYSVGYVTRDGSKLDFSGGQPGRARDHREINAVFDRGFDKAVTPMLRFLADGNIRINATPGWLAADVSSNVTADQVEALKDLAGQVLEDGGGDARVFLRVRDAQSGAAVAELTEPIRTRSGVAGHIRTALRQADEAGYDTSNIRRASQEAAEPEPAGSTPLTDDEVLAVKGYPQAPRADASAADNHIRDVAVALKEGDREAIREAADHMAELIPRGAKLVPIPDSDGLVEANGMLADEIARQVNGEVVDVLRANARESQYARRQAGKPGLDVDDIQHELVGDPGTLQNAYLVDNVVATGNTAQSARRAVGRDVPVLAWAKEPSLVETRARELHEAADDAARGGDLIRERKAKYSTGAPYEPLTREDLRGLGKMDAGEFGPVWSPDSPRLETPEQARQTRTRLLHGTSRTFSRFDPAAPTNYLPRKGGGFFFTTDGTVARRFAEEGAGPEAVNPYTLEAAFDRGRPTGDVLDYIEEPGDIQLIELKRLAKDRLEAGYAVHRYDADGQLQRITHPNQLEPEDVEGGLINYPPGHQPRIVMAEVPGYVLDLRHPDEWPQELIDALEASGDGWDSRLLSARRNAVRGVRGRPDFVPDLNRPVANSPTIHRFTRDRDIGKILVSDEYESGFESVYVPQPEAVELVDARPIGREPPTHGAVREGEGRYGQEDIFGRTAPAEGGDQFDMGLEGGRAGPEGLNAAEERARRTVLELQHAVDAETATPSQLEAYNEAMKLLRRNDAVKTDELVARARQQAAEEPPRPADEAQGDIFGSEAGAALPKALRHLALAGGGGAAGAGLDEENPWRGAAIGAMVGMTASALPGAWTDAMAGRKRTLRERMQEAVEAAARGEPPGAPEYRGPGRITDEELEETLNFEKFDLDPEGTERLKSETERVAQLSGVKAPHQVVSLEEVRELARQLALDPSDVLPQTAERMTGAELTALGNIVTENVEKIVRMEEALNAPGLTKSQEEVLLRNLQTRQTQNNELLERILRGRSQKGRDLSHLRTVSTATRGPDGKQVPEYWYMEAKRMLGDEAFTTEHAAQINAFIEADDVEGLTEYVAELRRPGFSEKMVTWWKASLMSAPITQIRNLTGNTSMQVLETLKDPPAWVFDRIVSLAFDTGLHTKSAPRPTELARASWKGVKRGAREADRVLRLRKSVRAARDRGLREGLEEFRTSQVFEGAQRKYDLTRTETSFNNVFADTFTKTIFRSMLGGDRFFKSVSFMRSLDEMARVVAKMEGLERGTDAFAGRAEELLHAPTDEMVAQAIHDAEVATFTNRNTLGDVGRSLKREIPLMEAVIPFTNTPANIALRTVDYSPFGYLRSAKNAVDLYKAVAEGITDASKRAEAMRLQRELAHNLGRNTVGTFAVAALGYWLAKEGLMTGGWPSDRQTQREWQLRGIPANGIYLPEGATGVPEAMQGSWNTIENISPWGNIMAFGANVYDVVANPETTGATDVIAGSATSIVSTVTEQSFLTGLSDALSALNNPERASGDAFRRTVSSFLVPNIVKKAVEGFDPYYRESETFGEELGRRLPQALRVGPLETPPARTVLGDPIERPGGVLRSMFDPFNQRTDRAAEDDVVYELSRTDVTIPEIQQGDEESLEAYRARRERVGQAVRRGISALVASDAYRSIPQVAERAIEQNAQLRGKLDPEEYARELQGDLIRDLVTNTKRRINRRLEIERASQNDARGAPREP